MTDHFCLWCQCYYDHLINLHQIFENYVKVNFDEFCFFVYQNTKYPFIEF